MTETDYDGMGGFYEKRPEIQRSVSVNTQDSTTFLDAPLKCGNIHFIQNEAVLGSQVRCHDERERCTF